MKTVWGEQLKENSVLPEYPRPQLKRSSFLNLNGPWSFYMGPAEERPEKLPETILVPFSPESELSGMEGTTTELIFMQNEPTLVTLRRTGTVRCALVMEEHKQHSGVYETPVMPLDLTVTTHSLINTITEDGGYMEAYYSLRFGTVTTTRTRLKVEVLLG